MLRKFKTYLVAGTLLTGLFATYFASGTAYAANSLYFDPSSTSVLKDGQITIVARASGTNFNVAQLDLSFDPASLQYVSYSASGSVLPNVAAYSTGSGTVSLALYNISAVTGDNQTLASFTFKALKGSGSSAISLQSSSALVSAGNKIAGGGAQCTVTFTSPAPAPTPTPAPTPAPTPSPTPTAPKPTTSTTQPSLTTQTTTATPQPTVTGPSADNTPPAITTIAPIGFSGDVISIKVVSDESTRSIVKFGMSKDALLQSVNSGDLASSYFVSLGELSKTFSPDKTYYYSVETTDAAGNKTTSPVKELTVSPVKVTLTIKDASGNVVRDTIVIINGKEFKTNSEGVVSIPGVIPGSVAVSIKKGDKEEYLGELTAVAGIKDQAFEISPSGSKKVSNQSLPLGALSASIVALIGLAAGLYILRRGQIAKREARLHSPNPWGKPVQPSHNVNIMPQPTFTPGSSQPAQNPSTPFSPPSNPQGPQSYTPPTVITPSTSQPPTQPTSNDQSQHTSQQ